jgi:gamma-glutamyltranspeptidase / glutathione hydrolase
VREGGAVGARGPRVASGPGGMVATAHWKATEAGARALEAGGNAFDAAVAAAFALCVAEPAGSGLGGQTMVLLHASAEGRTMALDGSSRVPRRADPRDLDRADCLYGYRATTVPSTPAVLDHLLERFGTLPLERALEPAIGLARDGYPVSPLQEMLARREREPLASQTGGRLFLRPDGSPYPAGTIFRQPALARTLETLAREGIDAFYRGSIAERIDGDMRRHGGLLGLDDLDALPPPVDREPLRLRFAGRELSTFPPPGGGALLVDILGALSELGVEELDPDTPAGAVRIARVLGLANRNRQVHPLPPDAERRRPGGRALAGAVRRWQDGRREKRGEIRGETTHLSVMDDRGNAVALTQSIERVFGSMSATEDLGFLYNDYMSAFDRADPTHPYFLRPGAVPWGSVAPTVVHDAGSREAGGGAAPVAVLGSTGDERISSTLALILLRMRSGDPGKSVAAPRLHCTPEWTVPIEAERFPPGVVEEIERCGFDPEPREAFSFYMGAAQVVVRERDTFIGAADPRRDGSAGGPRG